MALFSVCDAIYALFLFSLAVCLAHLTFLLICLTCVPSYLLPAIIFSSFLLCPSASPTLPPLKSEHFKPCQEKDLAYCLNDGECFVIETLSGPHKHCRYDFTSCVCGGGKGYDCCSLKKEMESLWMEGSTVSD